MDKIFSESWGDVFSKKEHQVIYAGGRYAESVATFEEPGLASVKMSSIATPGITLIKVDMSSERKLALIDNVEEEGLSSVFSLKGGIESKFNTLSKPINITEKSHSFQYNPNFQASHILHSGSMEVYSFIINIEFFKTLICDLSTHASDQIANSLEKKQNFLVAPNLLKIQPRMQEIIYAIQNNSFQNLTKYLFIEAKMLELLALQLDQINQVPEKEKISTADKEKFKALYNYVEDNFLLPLRLPELCRQFGLNEFKLKKGYKQLFHITVFGHIHQLRMLKAKQLLAEKQMNVSEVAFFIGYNNVGSFTDEFKKRFGYAPSNYIK